MQNNKEKQGGFKKINDCYKIPVCNDPQHSPPNMIVLEPGVYEYTCPSCGSSTIVNVPSVKLSVPL